MAGAENTFDGGTGVNLDSITTGNAGGSGNTQFDNISTIAPAFSNTFAHSGSQCLVSITTTNQLRRASWTPADSNVVFQRGYFRREAQPVSGAALLMGVWTDNSSAQGLPTFAVRWHTTGYLTAVDSVTTPVWTAGTQMPLSEWVRIETWQNRSTGQARLKGWTGANLEAEASPNIDSGVLTGLSMDLGAIWRVGYGNCSSTNSGTTYVDDVAWSTVDWIGPHGVEQPGVTTDVTVVMGAP